MKALVITYVFFIILTPFTVKGQCFIDSLEKERMNVSKNIRRSPYFKENVKRASKELKLVSELIKRDYQINLCLVDTIYLISGYDLESGFSEGRLWNNNFEFRYRRTIDIENFKIKNDSITVYQALEDQHQILEQFNGLTNLIEKKDSTELYRIQKENYALSGWIYTISIIEQDNTKFHISEISLNDFFILDEKLK